MTNTNKTRDAISKLVANHRDIANESHETSVALDAVESCDPRASALLVGCPCTMSIGSDSCAEKIESVTPSLHTITIVGGRVFRYSSKHNGYRSGSHWLHIGFARDYRDPCF